MIKKSRSSLTLLYTLWKNISNKRKKQSKILLFIMIISAFAEVFSIASVIPLLTALTNPDSLNEQKYIQLFLNSFNINNEQLVILSIFIFAIGA